MEILISSFLVELFKFRILMSSKVITCWLRLDICQITLLHVFSINKRLNIKVFGFWIKRAKLKSL